MEGRLRLANRQQVLTGRKINRAQRYAIDLIQMMEYRDNSREKAARFVDEIKMAAMAHTGPSSASSLWPHLFSSSVPSVPTDPSLPSADDDHIEALADHEPTTWVMPEQEVSPEDAERIIRELMGDTTMVISASDLDDEGGWV